MKRPCRKCIVGIHGESGNRVGKNLFVEIDSQRKICYILTNLENKHENRQNTKTPSQRFEDCSRSVNFGRQTGHCRNAHSCGSDSRSSCRRLYAGRDHFRASHAHPCRHSSRDAFCLARSRKNRKWQMKIPALTDSDIARSTRRLLEHCKIQVFDYFIWTANRFDHLRLQPQ